MGHALKTLVSFHPQSVGFILSCHSMQNLMKMWKKNNPICNDPKVQHAGKFISKCLSEVFGIPTEDKRDEGKYNQFHAFSLVWLVTGKVEQWYLDLSDKENLFGKDCCSNNTICFHCVEHLEMHALFVTRKAVLENPDMKDEELKTLMIQEWPTKQEDIGGWSWASRCP